MNSNDAAVQMAQTKLRDKVKGNVQLDSYTSSENFNLFGYELSNVLDDILLVKYVDCNDDGTEILKNGVWVLVNVSTFTWRIGQVILAGPNCTLVEVGDHVCFPNDKGIQVGNLVVKCEGKLANSCFLNEDRIFGVCEPVSE